MLTRRRSPVRTLLGAAALAVALLVGVIVLAVELLAQYGAQQCALAPAGPVAGPPAQLVPIYQAAAAKYGLGPLGPATLAAINEVETNFGQNLSTSSAGAVGWMQFEPSSWARYGVTPAGAKAPYGPAGWDDPQDAIFSAANLLQASGAPGSWQGAVFAYNHAASYVDQVLSLAHRYYTQGLKSGGGQALPVNVSSGSCSPAAAPGRYVNPFARAQGAYVTRLDMGVDVAAADGSPILALGDGQVTGAGTGIGGGWTCQGNYPNGGVVYRLTDGPDAGKYVYVAEDILPSVRTGETITAGQQVGTFAGSDCIETGWAASGAAGVSPYASALGGGYADGSGCTDTAAGLSFYGLLHALGLPSSSCASSPLEPGSHYP